MSEISKEQLMERAVDDCKAWNRRLYEQGYMDAMREFEQTLAAKGETTTLKEVEPEQKEDWKHFKLIAWCEKCGKGITEYWGFIDYCPYCGRRIVREDR